MVDGALLGVLSVGFGLGMLHALDADHIMAVSLLSSKSVQTPTRRTLRFCAQWALGHGGILLVAGALMLLVGVHIPPQLSFIAEKLVGVVLISLGGWILWQFWCNKLNLQVHSHGGFKHAHLTDKKIVKQHDHSPILIGVNHGLAGSAPALSLIPIAGTDHPLFGLLYILIFSVGVLTTMIIFGFCLGRFQLWLAMLSNRLFNISRVLMATSSIGFGIYWLFVAG